jgi:hypothetical protein
VKVVVAVIVNELVTADADNDNNNSAAATNNVANFSSFTSRF